MPSEDLKARIVKIEANIKLLKDNGMETDELDSVLVTLKEELASRQDEVETTTLNEFLAANKIKKGEGLAEFLGEGKQVLLTFDAEKNILVAQVVKKRTSSGGTGGTGTGTTKEKNDFAEYILPDGQTFEKAAAAVTAAVTLLNTEAYGNVSHKPSEGDSGVRSLKRIEKLHNLGVKVKLKSTGEVVPFSTQAV